MERKMTFKELEKEILKYNWRSDYKQAAIVVIREIFQSKPQASELPSDVGGTSCDCACHTDDVQGIYKKGCKWCEQYRHI